MVDSRNPQDLQARMQELLADEAFAKELLSMEKYEDVQDALEERGVELSLDEIRQVGELMQKAQSGEMSQEQLEAMADGNDELSEEELGEVAGGTSPLVIVVGLIVVGGISAAVFRW